MIDPPAHNGDGRHGRNSATFGRYLTTRTLAWVATCSHEAAAVPGVVLDPFAGACTTLMQAIRTRRSAIGIELSEEHADLGRERVELDIRLGHRPAQRPPEVAAAQAALFDP